MVTKRHVAAIPTMDSLARRLRRLQEVLLREDFQAAAWQHARGKLTLPEKFVWLFDAGTFVEDLVPHPDLDPRHSARRLVTGHGQMQGRTVAVALFDSSMAAGAVRVRMPFFQEERQQWEALRDAITAVWTSLSVSSQSYTALSHATATAVLGDNPEYHALRLALQAPGLDLEPEDADKPLHLVLAWLNVEMPAITPDQSARKYIASWLSAG